MNVVDATLRERLTALLTRCYPLNSGCGTLSNSGLVAALAGQRRANVWTRVFGTRALVPIHDLVGRSMYFTGDLDPKVSWAVARFARPGDVAFDVGANLGLVSLQLARTVGRTGRVHAFEPNPRMLAFLGATTAANPDLRIAIHDIALADSAGEMTLAIPDGNEGMATLGELWGRRLLETVTVRTERLAAFCAEQGIERIDFMKIDVEGFETEVLAGAAEFLVRARPRAILFEENNFSYGTDLPPSFAMLRDLDFDIFAVPRNLVRNRMVPIAHPAAGTAHDFIATPG